MKIMIIGAGPLPNEKKGIRSAAGLRTEQFISILKKGNKICLVTIEDESKSKTCRRFSVFTHFKKTKEDAKKIKKIFKNFQPDILIGVNNYPSYIASQIVDKKTPFWADLNGWLMAEIQAQSKSLGSNAFIPYAYKLEKAILEKADKISVVSTPQKHAIIGELAMLGRLSRQNFCDQTISVIRNSTKKFKTDINKTKKEIIDLPKNAFVVGQIGGFNAWFDEETLFKGLEKAMKKNPKIHFITTGGAIKGVDEDSYPRFHKRIKKSKFKNHFHLLGWIKTEKIPLVYAQSNSIINTDFDCTETTMGARNRLTESLKFSKTIITTLGSEIAKEIVEHEAGLGVNNGDHKNLAEIIYKLSKDKKLQEKLVKNGQKLLKEKYSDKICMKPVLEWIKNPQLAPDKRKLIKMKPNYFKLAKIYFKKRGAKAFFKKLWRKIK